MGREEVNRKGAKNAKVFVGREEMNRKGAENAKVFMGREEVNRRGENISVLKNSLGFCGCFIND